MSSQNLSSGEFASRVLTYAWNPTALSYEVATAAGSGVGADVRVTNTVPVTGTFWQATQPVSGTVGVSGTVPVLETLGTASWAQSLSVASGATATVVNIPSSTAGYQVKGFVCHGTGDGYFFIQVNGSTVLSGRTRATAPMLNLNLINGIAVTTGSTVALKVTNESGSTADYDAILLGA